MYTYEEVYSKTLEYFHGDDVLARIWISKYCLKDQKGNYYEATPDDMHRRIANEFARIEKNYPNPIPEEDIYSLLKDFKYLIPQGSPMWGIGNPFMLTSLSNCFVIDSPYDSYAGIIKSEQQMISIMKRRGGVGLSIDTLRPKDMPTTSVSEKSSGLVLFSERYSNTTREVAQDGRRGALMISCRVDHPDILHIIRAKADLTKITGANMSIMITDEFMRAVRDDREYEVFFESSKGSVRHSLSARLVWNEIIHNAWKVAEPGVLFWDTILRESPADCYAEEGYRTTSTNPCGEIPLCPYDSCRLMALNLYSYVEHPFEDNSYFNFRLLKDHVNAAQQLMDDLIDLEIEKIKLVIDKLENDDDPEDLKPIELNLWKGILNKAVNGRRTGLGVTAIGDMLAALELQYGTDEAIDFIEEVQRTIAVESYKASIEMAEERGCFPIWSKEKEQNNPFIDRIVSWLNEDFRTEEGQENTLVWHYEKYGRRNIANLTIAPTGTVSQLTQTTSGIEPVFLPIYKRRRKTPDPARSVFVDQKGDMWEEYRVIHPKFQVWYDKNWNKIGGSEKKSIQDMTDVEVEELVKKSPYYKSTSNDVDWVAKVRMQGRVQQWVDHSISVTVNLPKEATEELVSQVYMTAWESGCKGCTVYRDGSRQGILLSDKQKEEEGLVYKNAPKRPEVLDCDIYHKTALGKDWTVVVGLLNSKPYEIFAFEQLPHSDFPKEISKGKIKKVKKRHYRLSGVRNEKEYVIDNILPYLNDNEKTGTRRYSLMLRSAIKPVYIVQQIEKYADITSFDKVISRVLKNYTNGEKSGDSCPSCGSALIFEDGCEKCPNGDYSKCG